MTVRPILFSAPMVRALLDGRKTQTRRVLTRHNATVLGHSWRGKSSPWDGLRFAEAVAGTKSHLTGCHDPHLAVPFCHPADEPMASDECGIYAVRPIVEVGDRLWVRETFARVGFKEPEKVYYRADGEHQHMGTGTQSNGNVTVYYTDFWELNGERRKGAAWKPGIYMPRWASRLTLTVTDVRVQRLQDISEEDAIAEGATERPNCSGVGDRESGWCMDWSRVGQPSKWATDRKTLQERDVCLATARHAFWNLFDKINDLGTWNANPWVVALTFIVERRNIDTTEAT